MWPRHAGCWDRKGHSADGPNRCASPAPARSRPAKHVRSPNRPGTRPPQPSSAWAPPWTAANPVGASMDLVRTFLDAARNATVAVSSLEARLPAPMASLSCISLVQQCKSLSLSHSLSRLTRAEQGGGSPARAEDRTRRGDQGGRKRMRSGDCRRVARAWIRLARLTWSGSVKLVSAVPLPALPCAHIVSRARRTCGQ